MSQRRQSRSNTNEMRYQWARVGAYWFAWFATLMAALLIDPKLLAGTLLFPMGLLILFPNGTELLFYVVPIWPIVVLAGWSIYGALTFFMMRTKRGWLYICLYVIFCALLALNLKCCYEISQMRFE